MTATDWQPVAHPGSPEAALLVTDRKSHPDGLLDRVERFLGRFVAYPSEDARVAHVLWCAHAHLLEAFESTPRIAFLSPEPGSGKSRALEASEPLVPRPLHSVNVTPAYLFRKVADEAGPPTILFDEIDTIFGPKAKENEDIRGLLNAGHRKGATAGRCVVRGKTVETEELPAFCAVALAGLGDMPDTLMSRAVVLRMRRRAPHERVEAFRPRLHWPEGHVLRDELAKWAGTVRARVGNPWPDMPEGVEDRNADVWEALLVIADVAGGDWPRRARRSAVALVADSQAGQPSLGVRLLADLRSAFAKRGGATATTEVLLTELREMDEAPWDNLRGEPLDARGLAKLLGKYGVKSKSIRLDAQTVVRGYHRADLLDPWSRYLPEPVGPSSQDSATSATGATAQVDGPSPVADTLPVAEASATGAPLTCRVCGDDLDPVIWCEGDVHPGCDEAA